MIRDLVYVCMYVPIDISIYWERILLSHVMHNGLLMLSILIHKSVANTFSSLDKFLFINLFAQKVFGLILSSRNPSFHHPEIVEHLIIKKSVVLFTH